MLNSSSTQEVINTIIVSVGVKQGGGGRLIKTCCREKLD